MMIKEDSPSSEESLPMDFLHITAGKTDEVACYSA